MKTDFPPFEAEYRLVGPDPKNALPHFSDQAELIQTWSDGGFFIVNHRIFPIQAGTILLIDAENLHYSNPEDPDCYNRSKVIISKEWFHRITSLCGIEDFLTHTCGAEGGAAWYIPPDSARSREIDSCFFAIAEVRKHPEANLAQMQLVSHVIRILELLCEEPRKEAYPDDSRQTIQLLAKFINERLTPTADLTMDDIAEALHISTSRAYHLFPRLTGKTLTAYMTELKMAEAKKMLLTTPMKIREISLALGYGDPTVFCRYFKKETGKTPLAFRKGK